ncbi:MAG: prephenate dehydrogenase [Candidatus Hydrothermarchaeota archaeon]
MIITIVGGYGAMGRWLVKLLKEKGFEVRISGRNAKVGEAFARKMRVEFFTDNVEAVKEADVVIVSVPISVTEEVIKEIAPHMKDGSLLMDIASIKEGPANAMLKYAKESVELIPAHPMFGPSAPDLKGQVVLLTPLRSEIWLPRVKSFLEKEGARVHITTPEEHDRIMSIIQGLTHFVYIATGITLGDLNVDVEYTKRFASPVYQMMLDMIARIVGQDPHMYAMIQIYNPRNFDIHSKFIENAESLRKIIIEGRKEDFVEKMSKAARKLGDVEGALRRSDKAIRSLYKELELLKSKLGENVVLRHVYSKNFHYGKLKHVDPENVILETKKGDITLKTSNIEVLSDEDANNWIIQNFPKKNRDFSFVVEEKADNEIIRYVFSLIPNVTSVEIIDEYKGPQIPEGKKSITLRVVSPSIYGDEVFRRTEEIINSLFKMR